jgi:hypothetical protein
MKTYKEFITEENIILKPNEWIEARNALVDIESIIKDVVKGWKTVNPNVNENDAKLISDWVKTKKIFSINAMFDAIGNDKISYGLLNAVIKKLKTEFAAAGFSKAGNISKTQNQAERIDKYLKQKWITK